MDEFNVNIYENDIQDNMEKNKIKLHYDYQSCDNLLNNNSILKTFDLLSPKEYNDNAFINLNNNLNSNLNNNLNYIPNYYTNTNNFLLDNNLNKTSKLDYNDESKIEDNKKDEDENKFIKKARNNSFNYSKIKINLKPSRDNMIINNFGKTLKYKENNLTDNENGKCFKKESNSEYNINLLNKENNKEKTNKYFYSTFNNLSDYLITVNDDTETYNKINENNTSKENKSNGINKKFQNNKSSPHFKTYLNIESNENNKLLYDNNKLEKEKKEIIEKFRLLKTKYDSLSKDNFIIKTKYEVNKNNIKILQKKLEEKIHDIEQMKKILLSNNQQINFLNNLKDTNIKTAKDNEELIKNLKDTISNLNKIIIQNNNKINYLNKQNQSDKFQKIKQENETLKIFLNERDKNIASLKNLISILTQNLDNILNSNQDNEEIIEMEKSEENEENEKIINECELKIKEFKVKIGSMQKKMNEILLENNNKEKEKNELKVKNEEMNKKNSKMIEELEDLKTKYEEQKKEIEKYKNKIIENNQEIEEKNKKYEEIKKEMNNKNNEIIEKANEIEELKIDIENKINEINDNKNEIEEKNEEIRGKNNEIEIKNKEIKEKGDLMKEKEKEIEEKNNIIKEKESELVNKSTEIDNLNNQIKEKQSQIDLQNKKIEEKENEIKNLNQDFFEKVKQFEIDIKNKDKMIYNSIENIKENKEIVLEYKNNNNNNTEKSQMNDKENKNNITEEKAKYDNNNNKNYEDKSNIKTNFDYNNYKDKYDFSNELDIKEEFNNKENKIKNKLKKEKIKRSKKTIKNKLENKNIIFSYEENQENIYGNINPNYYKDMDNSDNYKIKNSNEQFNYIYSKTEIDKNNELIQNNFIKDSKNKNNNLYNNYINQNNKIYNNKLQLDLSNYNEEDISIKQTNHFKNDINDIKYKEIINDDLNDINDINNKNKSISIENEDINDINYNYLESQNNIYQFNSIFSLIGSDIISFDLKEKKFEIITPKDDTNGIFNTYIDYNQKNKLYPLTLNTPKGFYILLYKYILYYDQITNSLSIVIKLFSNHSKGNFIYIDNNIYSISGINTTQCEKYSLISNKNILLSNTNFPRINSGICNVNNEYIYAFFGKCCENSIERLYIGANNYNKNWEIINVSVNINENRGVKETKIGLDKFVTFLDDFNNIIIFGGEDYKGKENKNIFGFNLDSNSLTVIGKIDSCSNYSSQFVKLDESIYSVYDINNGLHFFNKELDYHEIFNLNV